MWPRLVCLRICPSQVWAGVMGSVQSSIGTGPQLLLVALCQALPFCTAWDPVCWLAGWLEELKNILFEDPGVYMYAGAGRGWVKDLCL